MSQSICSGWFDTRQAWPTSRPEFRRSEMWSGLMGSSLKLHRRVQGRSPAIASHQKNAQTHLDSFSGNIKRSGFATFAHKYFRGQKISYFRGHMVHILRAHFKMFRALMNASWSQDAEMSILFCDAIN